MTKILTSSESTELTITPSEALNIIRELSGLVGHSPGGYCPTVSAGYNGQKASFYIDESLASNCVEQEIHNKNYYFRMSTLAAKKLIVHLVNNLDSEVDVHFAPDFEGLKFLMIISKIY